MKIRKVWGENFGRLEKVEFSLADQGLVAVQGENKDTSAADSNGSGKSTLMELVSWVLFGTTVKGSSGDAIIRRGEKQAKGNVHLEDDEAGEHWQVQRFRSKGKETLVLMKEHPAGSGHWETHTLGTNKLTQAAIERVLGCNQEVFRAAVYVGQEDIPDLPAMTDKQLKEIIERAAGVDVLEQVYAEARVRAGVAEKRLIYAKNAEETIKDNIEAQDYLVSTLLGEEIRWRDEHADRIEANRFTIVNIDNQISEALKQQAGAPALATLNKAIAAIDSKFQALDAERDTEARLIREEANAESALIRAKRDMDAAVEKHNRSCDRVKAVTSKIGTPCGECGTIITAGHMHSVEEAAIASRDLSASAASVAIDALKKAQETHRQAVEALAAHRKGMTDTGTLSAQRTKLALAKRAREELDQDIEQLKRRRQEAADLAIKFDTETWPGATKLQEEKDRAAVLVTDLAAAEFERQAAEQALEEIKIVVQVFGPTGVRAHMLDEVTPYLNTQTSEYLTVMSDGDITAVWNTLSENSKGELKERFAIDVQCADGGSFLDLSGGEKRKVRIACALALQDLVASRATKPFHCWIADEIDTALDPAGLERLMMVLQVKARERGTVVVISHSDLSSWIPNVWTVTREHGKSLLKV